MGKEEFDWMGTHSEIVSKYCGKWIALYKDQGIIAAGNELDQVARTFKEKLPGKTLCVFRVPREDEEIIAL
tara:strand:+ start:141 stop:353 length:213 start_codon:yes stop_codon:yes gene_type:complete